MAWRTTNDPKTEFVTIRFTVSEAADLDAFALASGMKRSAYARDCVRRVIAAEQKKAARLAGKSPVSTDGGV